MTYLQLGGAGVLACKPVSWPALRDNPENLAGGKLQTILTR
jgi:hypothetical protein